MECLVPLVIRYEGKIECNLCQVSVNIPINEELISAGNKETEMVASFEESLQIVTAEDIPEL
jgi:uncharacterized Zn finger protein (UPF0148 family)